VDRLETLGESPAPDDKDARRIARASRMSSRARGLRELLGAPASAPAPADDDDGDGDFTDTARELDDQDPGDLLTAGSVRAEHDLDEEIDVSSHAPASPRQARAPSVPAGPTPRPTYSDADEFPDEAFEESAKVREVEYMLERLAEDRPEVPPAPAPQAAAAPRPVLQGPMKTVIFTPPSLQQPAGDIETSLGSERRARRQRPEVVAKSVAVTASVARGRSSALRVALLILAIFAILAALAWWLVL
jgi:hypothetical protein